MVEELMTPKQVAIQLQISLRSLFRMEQIGAICPAIRFATGTVRWKRSDLENWIAMGCPGGNDKRKYKKIDWYAVLSVRAANLLVTLGIQNIAGLAKCSRYDLMKHRGFGNTCLRQVKRFLQKYGLALKGEVTELR